MNGPDGSSGPPGGGAATPLAAPYVHPSAVVDAGAVLEPGVRVWHFAHVCSGAVIGAGTSLGQGVYVGPDVRIGRGCRIQNNVSVYAGVTLADEVFVGPSAVFTNVRTPRAHVSRRDELAPTLVGRRATVGANATVVCGTRLGEACFVGAGAVVTRDVAPRALVLGSPARRCGHACDCGERLRGVEAGRAGLGAGGTGGAGGAGGGGGAGGAGGGDAGPVCARCGARYVLRPDGGLDLAAGARPGGAG